MCAELVFGFLILYLFAMLWPFGILANYIVACSVESLFGWENEIYSPSNYNLIYVPGSVFYRIYKRIWSSPNLLLMCPALQEYAEKCELLINECRRLRLEIDNEVESVKENGVPK
jgi:hypothetical protein